MVKVLNKTIIKIKFKLIILKSGLIKYKLEINIKKGNTTWICRILKSCQKTSNRVGNSSNKKNIYSLITSFSNFLSLISQVLKAPSPSKSVTEVARIKKELFEASMTSILYTA
jgi:hypothetical protein